MSDSLAYIFQCQRNSTDRRLIHQFSIVQKEQGTGDLYHIFFVNFLLPVNPHAIDIDAVHTVVIDQHIMVFPAVDPSVMSGKVRRLHYDRIV